MMSGSFGYPTLQESPDLRLEESSRIGIPRWRNRPSDTLALTNDELKSPGAGHTYSQHGDRSFLDLKFHTRSRSRFAVIFREAAQYRAAIGNIEVMRPVVSHQHKTFLEVHRVKLRKTAADLYAILNQHGHTGLQVRFSAHRKPCRAQKRIADD